MVFHLAPGNMLVNISIRMLRTQNLMKIQYVAFSVRDGFFSLCCLYASSQAVLAYFPLEIRFKIACPPRLSIARCVWSLHRPSARGWVNGGDLPFDVDRHAMFLQMFLTARHQVARAFCSLMSWVLRGGAPDLEVSLWTSATAVNKQEIVGNQD